MLPSLRTFDPHNSGQIGETEFRKIMKSKEGIPDEDIEEMLEGEQFTVSDFIDRQNI